MPPELWQSMIEIILGAVVQSAARELLSELAHKLRNSFALRRVKRRKAIEQDEK